MVIPILIQLVLVKPGLSLVTCLCQGAKGLRWAQPILVSAKKATIDRPGANYHYLDLHAVAVLGKSANVRLCISRGKNLHLAFDCLDLAGLSKRLQLLMR